MSDTALGRTPLRVHTAEEVRVLLARRRLSASKLAKAMGVSQTYVWRRLSGETAFDLDDLEKIADILEVDVGDLLPRRGHGGPDVRPPSAPSFQRVTEPGIDPSITKLNYPHLADRPSITGQKPGHTRPSGRLPGPPPAPEVRRPRMLRRPNGG